MSNTIEGDVQKAASLRNLFARFRPRIVSRAIADFSRLNWSCRVFCEVQPTTLEELSEIVRLAAQNGIALRTRGNGHALNGSSLPQRGELLVRTLSLAHAREPQDGVVSAGAGCVLWHLDAWLRSKGYGLPVINAGYAGPTIGGFVAAGGFGRNSAVAGGFWNNVSQVTIVDGMGNILVVGRQDALFPWLFGSMGQLGIVAEVELDVVPHDPGQRSGDGFRNTQRSREKEMTPPVLARDEAGRLFWFSLFVHEPRLDEACTVLDELEKEHFDAFNLRERYTYRIAHRAVVAPLVWPEAVSCHAVGSWGLLQDTSPERMHRVLAFDADFMRAARINGYRRYVQSEVPSGPAFYARYFGDEIYAMFRAQKSALDPHELFNRAAVFPIAAVP
ncbi:MAG TPA: FAD-binding oxidoreductase [Xanthobacteraceae bacterium]|nr:FAD-binding oxidoreductase [Xanthobacteraceae bacterium]